MTRHDRIELHGVDLSSYLTEIPVLLDATDAGEIATFRDMELAEYSNKFLPEGLIAQIAQHFGVNAEVAEGIIWAYIEGPEY